MVKNIKELVKSFGSLGLKVLHYSFTDGVYKIAYLEDNTISFAKYEPHSEGLLRVQADKISTNINIRVSKDFKDLLEYHTEKDGYKNMSDYITKMLYNNLIFMCETEMTAEFKKEILDGLSETEMKKENVKQESKTEIQEVEVKPKRRTKKETQENKTNNDIINGQTKL